MNTSGLSILSLHIAVDLTIYEISLPCLMCCISTNTSITAKPMHGVLFYDKIERASIFVWSKSPHGCRDIHIRILSISSLLISIYEDRNKNYLPCLTLCRSTNTASTDKITQVIIVIDVITHVSVFIWSIKSVWLQIYGYLIPRIFFGILYIHNQLSTNIFTYVCMYFLSPR